MIVVLSDTAEQDLERIADHIAIGNRLRALSFIGELRDKCGALAEMPERFPLIPRYETAGVRRRSYGNFLIFYRIERDRVVVLHILHGAQDYLPILFPM